MITKEKPSIIRIFPKVTDGTGGMEHHIRTLTEEQRLQGHKVILMLNEGEKKNIFDLRIKPDKKLYSSSHPKFLGIFQFYFWVILRILKDKITSDIIHIHGDWSSFIFAPLIKKIVNARNVYFTMHSSITTSFTHRRLLPIFLKFSDKTFTTSYDGYKIIEQYNQAIFQPSGVDEVFFDHSRVSFNKISNIICVAQFRPIKNISLVLLIAKKMPNIRFTIVGDGIEKDRLMKQMKDLKLENVVFTGKLTKKEIATLLSSHDLFLLTSLDEGTPTAIMEAMASGLPIVCSNAGGVESIIKDKKNGYVIKNDYNDIDAYVEAILKISSNESQLREISKNNIEKAQEFHWSIVANNITNEMICCTKQ